jgi:hypothetical protein
MLTVKTTMLSKWQSAGLIKLNYLTKSGNSLLFASLTIANL